MTVSSFIPPKWIDSLFALKSTTNVMHRMVVPSMYRAIPKETICTSIQDETGTIVATGLGIRDRDYVGVYAIHVHPAYRHRHYASSICRTIFRGNPARCDESISSGCRGKHACDHTV